MDSEGEAPAAGTTDPPSTEQLLQAAASADAEDLRRLTQYYTTDVDIRNQDGLSALHLAILSQHDGAVEALVEANADIEATTPAGKRPLFLAIEESRTEVVRFLLAHHALTDADAGGRMPLHEAASRGNVHVVRLLLDYGADIQALSTDERDALFFAVRSQNVAVARLLLDRGADPDAYLSEDPPTALHLASELCDVEMMRMLLERRAKVDLRDFNGATPLFRVVAAGNIEAAKLLLQHGASIRVWASGGFSALDLADGNLEMLELLNGDRVLQGPKVRGAGPTDEPEATFTVLKPPPTPAEHERDKLTACQGFNAIITDFFLNGEEHEQSVPKTASVYELLYSHGPGAIRSRLDGRDPSYTWYHLPSNNVGEQKLDTGLHILIPFNLADGMGRDPAFITKSQTKLTKQGFTGNTDSIVAFVPFLHFETFAGHQAVEAALARARDRPNSSKNLQLGQLGVPIPPAISVRTRKSSDEAPASRSRPATLSSINAAVDSALGKIGTALRHNSRSSAKSTVAHDLERQSPGQAGEQAASSSRNNSIQQDPSVTTPQGGIIPQKLDHRSSLSDTGRRSPPSTSQFSPNEGQQSDASHNLMTADTNESPAPKPGSDNHSEAQRSGSPRKGQESEPEPKVERKTRMRTKQQGPRIDPPQKNLHEHLFRGYFNSGTSDLQPRRTLDQYVYADIEASSNRDNDQVVYRYTKDSRAKIFMVDQLWLWILGEDTIITCCPVRWSSWETKRPRQAEMPTAETSKPGFYIKWFSGMVHNPHASLVSQRAMGYRPMMIGGHGSKEPRASQPRRNMADGTWPELKLDDPLNVSQIVNRHLLKQNRSAVESVFELAGLITTCCVDLFDPYQVSEDYLFLDFFENSIGQASDKSQTT
ncbi:ankyrin repeat and protein kinase domain-containing protein [Verticillium alfalfae VaMs.102]|uniref:Ankyrin repeat and protein kinase domain-containing protein n=1 Tax=Verticillium alfalfae (strain VaMs.102 / ATCC MYA-4576 / FGSC 10136) TaxID=526221 RepID=C9SQ74_VERA1|nr:ankyrin repeat and protein kinase domain-containing protein [Verticillium alfalfae VaMs.102]EEY20999.1 ankyrin repeat and protein kinase domain-containing protein [Verticillium alfalfae VaMs.102]